MNESISYKSESQPNLLSHRENRILIVDRDVQYARQLVNFLDDHLLRLDGVIESDVDSAIERAIDERFDLIYSGYAFDESNGLELLEAVRAEKQLQPFILASEHFSLELEHLATDRNVTCYLEKPGEEAEYAELLEQVELVLDRVHIRNEASKLSQLHALFRSITESVNQASSEQHVLDIVCQQLVEFDRYVEVSVSHLSLSETGTNGTSESASRHRSSVSETERAGDIGLCNRAIKTGEIRVCRCEGEPATDSEELDGDREEWQKAAIPLTFSDTTFGAIEVVSGHSDSFRARERSILTEIGSVVGHAIHRIRAYTELGQDNSTDRIQFEVYRRVFEFFRTQSAALEDVIRDDVAQFLTDLADDLLPSSLFTIYTIDIASHRLTPIAVSSTLEERIDTLPVIDSDAGKVWEAYVDSERLSSTDTRPSALPGPLESELDDWRLWPIPGHGVLIAGTSSEQAFPHSVDGVHETIAEATALALDVMMLGKNATTLRNEVTRRDDRLSNISRLHETTTDVMRSIAFHQSREEIERAVCDQLTDIEAVRFCWIGAWDDQTERVAAHHWAGHGSSYLDVDRRKPEGNRGQRRPADRAVTSRKSTVINDLSSSDVSRSWGQEALARGFSAVISVPLLYRDRCYGALTIFSDDPDGFGIPEQRVFETLGETVALAMNAVERHDGLLADNVIEFRCSIPDDYCVFNQITEVISGSLTLEKVVREKNDEPTAVLRLHDTEMDTGRTLEQRIRSVKQATFVDRKNAVVKIVPDQPLLGELVSTFGGTVQSLSASRGTTSAVIEFPRTIDTKAVFEVLRDSYPDLDVEAISHPTREVPERKMPEDHLANLTERQREILATALSAGFFDWPRGNSGEEMAEMIGVSPPTFHRHVREAEKKVFSELLERYQQ